VTQERPEMRLRPLAVALVALSAAPALAQSDAPVLEEIVVTGSRIARPVEESPVPLSILGAAELEKRGIVSITEAISRMPALKSTSSADQTTTGLVTANLRGLGANRTLVLVNGRRHVAGVAGSASVDLSSIPSAMIERVDVLTGGASAVYGSDAVTGVVNFILKKDFEGQDFRAQYGLSEQGDADKRYAAATVGRNFDEGRGNALFSVSVADQAKLRFGDRRFSRDNGIGDDAANPDLFIQAGDITPALTAARITPGMRILSLDPAIVGPTLTSRAQNARARAFGADPRFGLSSLYGIIGFDPRGTGFPVSATNARAPAIDFDNNGVRDCQQSFPGRRGFGCLVIDPVNGRLRPFQDGVLANNDQFGGDGTPDNLNRSTLVPDLSTVTADLILRHDTNPFFKPFVEAKVARNRAENTESVRTFDDSIRIKLDNPFIPQALRDIANAQIAAEPGLANTYQFIITRDHSDIVDPVVTSKRTTYRGVLGFEGELANGWSYEAAYNYGRTEGTDNRPNRLNDRFFAAIDAVRAPDGSIVCRSFLNPNAIPAVSDFPVFSFTGYNSFDPRSGACKPLNLFGLEAPSQEARDFVTVDNPRRSVIAQQSWTASIGGDLLELPAGGLGFAAGLEHRSEESRFSVTEFERRGFTDRGGEQDIRGDFHVTEAFVELNAPLLRDLPLAHLLSVDAAYRYGDYSTVGSVNAYKFGAVYAPISDVRLRGGYARTLRAPNITELFQPRSSSLFNVVDPCDSGQVGSGPNPANRRTNCAADGIPAGFLDPRTARVPGFTGGNPALDAERSSSYTLGTALQPRFLPGLSVTADYWNIKISKAIAAPSGQDILNACYDAPSLDNPFCQQIARNRTVGSPTFLAVSGINQVVINFARFEASGLDFNLSYDVPLEDWGVGAIGDLSIGLTGTWNEKNRIFQNARDLTQADNELGERLNPKWSINPSLVWSYDKMSIAYYGFWQSRQTLNGVERETASTFVQSFAPSAWIHDASIGYRLTEQVNLTAGVNNIADKKPFLNELNRPASSIGRSFYLRAGVNF
jgi:iron complex outermembrane recepter protein